MRTRLTCIVLFSAVLFAVLAHPAQAQKAKQDSAASKNASPTSSRAQVDGIVARTVDNLWAYTDKYFHDGDYNRIIGLCRIVSEADPTYDEAYVNAAYLLWSQGDAPAADDFLQMGLSRSKNPSNLRYEMGAHLMRTKRPEAALPYLKKAAADPKAEPVVYVQLAHCYEQNKKMEEAVATWEKLVKKYPKFPSGPVNLARAKKQLNAKS